MVNRILKARSCNQLLEDNNRTFSIENDAIFQESKRVIDSIEHFINKEIPKSEIDNLYRYLISSRFQNKKVVSETP